MFDVATDTQIILKWTFAGSLFKYFINEKNLYFKKDVQLRELPSKSKDKKDLITIYVRIAT